MPEPETRSGERIAKLLARAGIASRREVERMIAEGRVRIGEELVTTPATVLESLRGVTVDGKPVRAAEATRLFAFHKPDGLITAERDLAGRPTIYTALRNALPPGTPRVMPVGRLDLNTEGLLLMTNDGEVKRAMELPSSGIPRTYRARTFGEISQARLEELIEGVTVDGMNYGRIDANLERSTGRNQWIELTLSEGKNREVRRVLEHLGLQVSRLLRTAYGPFHLADLPRGAAVEIRQVDVERFCKSLKIAPAARPESAPVMVSSGPRKAAIARPVRTEGAARAARPGGKGADPVPERTARAAPRRPARKRDDGKIYAWSEQPRGGSSAPASDQSRRRKPYAAEPSGSSARPAATAKPAGRGKPYSGDRSGTGGKPASRTDRADKPRGGGRPGSPGGPRGPRGRG